VFFSFVIDAYSRRVVGWQFASHMRTTLVLDALRMALHQRQPGAEVALIQHTDAGSQYTSYDYTQTLDDHGVLASIGTVGDALDNAVAESFVDSFKTELITDRTWATRSQLELAVVEYVAWFNNERLHEALNDRPPREVEECERPANHPHQIKIGNLQTPPPSDPARLKHRREELGLTQEELHLRSDLHQRWISNVETGKRNPSFASLRRLAAALDLTASELLARAEQIEADGVSALKTPAAATG